MMSDTGVVDRSSNPAEVVDAVVQLGRALKRAGGTAPASDATTIRAHGDRKTLRAEREKKIAHSHREDNHADEPTWQQTM